MDPNFESDKTIKEIDIEQCIDTLKLLVSDREKLVLLPEDKKVELITLAGKLSRPDRDEIRKRNRVKRKAQKEVVRQQDKEARSTTGIRSAREAVVFTAPKLLEGHEQKEGRTMSSPRNCYVCKKEYTVLHHFYDSMCQECGDLNYAKRFQTADLTGQVALITGSRLKIGYQATLMMLRAGATVIATTRFPADSAIRFAKETDFSDWGHRLKIHGLDLRHIPSVELFASYIEQQYDRLDILINNAAQTVRRPAGFYAHLMENERLGFHDHSKEVQMLLHDHEDLLHHLLDSGKENKMGHLPVTWNSQEPGIGIRASAQLSQVPYKFDNSLEAAEVFPEGKLDADLQQVDLRKTNSWRLKLGEVHTHEMLEVQLVNSIAPFVLCNRLIDLMQRDHTGKKYVVNVTAMEGKFYRFKKESRHPHTNMAKAALNMLTHTAAGDLGKEGIFMNAVDTGWVTDEDPVELAKIKQDKHDFQPPLDIVDGAARVCDPFFDGINTGKHWCGQFLKDYFPIDW
ncbi:SDR family NAD(P)-dependent oxidoreductase [Fulvivirga sediminis]|uniref:SDR family oxidoreductase n=1 Tax=Fulvivirga sediminis TaxID=2803949 RepID=A0A937F8D1_9BACT|nr:SDR family oxidoreductase [Fulvivirga sediminis]MBL3658206.1 SDR family oxidoreductase [Fulvivirga sediminis]